MIIGCNYWASHAGLRMWSRWDEETVRADFDRMAGIGISTIRTFPLWPEFQPLTLLRSGCGRRRELTFGDHPLPRSEAGQAGVDEMMADRLEKLLDCAAAAGLNVELGLITGWMSGRLFVPPAFEGLNLLTDPLVIRWQVRMIRYLVRRFRTHVAVAGWSPGNECNCLAPADRDQAWLWCRTMTAAIRQEDDRHPISGGMHSLAPAALTDLDGANWTIEDHRDLFDRINTHPYPLFTPHAAGGRINAYRNLFHAVAETRFYADIAGLPGAIEEIGTLSPSLAGEEVKAAYLRNVIWNAAAHDIGLTAWWCAFDQINLDFAPYDWNAVERELGLFRSDGSPKPVAEMLRRLSSELKSLPEIRPAAVDAVCVLSRGQDAWCNAWGAMLLAEEIGLRLRFAYAGDEIPEADLYLVPGVCGDGALSRRVYLDLIDRAERGATVYFSLDDGLLAPLDSVFGLRSICREMPGDRVEMRLGEHRFELPRPARYLIEPAGAVAAGHTADGEAVFFDCRRGRGRLLLLTLPLERYAGEDSLAINSGWGGRAVYEYFAADRVRRHPAHSRDPLISVSCHETGDGRVLGIAVNNRPEAVVFEPLLAPGWRCGAWLKGSAGSLPGNDAAVFELIRMD